ncbi:DUF6285 domain-containing protein [Aromatoleum evansii]|uniref:DUF6285 domain-containing protein n=1 Tax=Aromatoleum evansii TaxID=59406 RepID=A0ABZ1AG81_AROEV|nr:DUF6285 domain-containing protein [Aromatoleum evansii]NMG32486.1 hypothetical protein [Aromatoleum evansii]WRL44883.1 DUF6285 domain-containing protein [Aromatoleum evansii]
MREQPKGDALLATARQILRDDVLPALPADRKYALLMVMNAMSIAERQLRNGDAPEVQELAELRELLDDSKASPAEGNRQLARLLRAGAGDPGAPQRAALFAHLRAAGRRRLAESNPKVLPGEPR